MLAAATITTSETLTGTGALRFAARSLRAFARVATPGTGVVLTMAGALDAAALAFAVSLPGPTGLVLGALTHLAAAALALACPLPRSSRQLGAALLLTLPGVGALVAAALFACRARPGAERELLHEDPRPRPPLTPDEVRRFADRLPTCSALTGPAEERRAALDLLTRRADADSVRLLRWAVGGPDPELAVEAALALEDLSVAFEERLAACQEALDVAPSFDAARAVGDLVAEALGIGLVDAPQVATMADEARRCYDRAARLGPGREAELTPAMARLELAALRPERALALVEGAMASGHTPDLEQLVAIRDAAAAAAHLWELGSWEAPTVAALAPITEDDADREGAENSEWTQVGELGAPLFGEGSDAQAFASEGVDVVA